jgi:catechol 2,3-dioxygenase-like lactoylglutathione lyase family enzyme
MGYHHLALACHDIQAIHAFYEGLLGFELVKIAFWELHEVPGADALETNISKAAGVPDQINHIAFYAQDMDDLQQRKERWLEAGLQVLEIDHNWCHSIYTKDPNDILVEFCVTTGSFTAQDRQRALATLTAQEPEFSPPPASIEFLSPP